MQRIIIDGAEYVSLTTAAWELCDPGDGRQSGMDRLLPLLQADVLTPRLCEPAPPHERAEYTGNVVLDQQFWNECWWDGRPGRDNGLSPWWQIWFWEGGIKVPAAEISAQVQLFVRKRQISAEIALRNTFQYRWPVTHVLAWIIARNDNAVRSIDVAREVERRTAWERLAEIAEEYSSGDHTGEQVLWAAFDQLAPALDEGKLEAWRVPPPYVAATKLDSYAFATAGLMVGQNSGGLLGVTFGASEHNHILMRPDEVRTQWLPAKTNPVGRKGGRRAEIDWPAVMRRAQELLADRPGLSIGSAAASLSVEFRKPNTGKNRDPRGIEKNIKHLWEGKNG